MMNEKWSGARARYEAAPVPEELNFAVAAAVRAGYPKQNGQTFEN